MARRASTTAAALLVAGAMFAREMPPIAHAAPPDKATCNAAYTKGQRARKAGDLIAARENFLLCARDPCPKVFQPECVQWLAEVEKILPSVVFEITSDAPPSAVKVSVDGVVVATRLDGTAVSVNPGEHTFRFEADDRPAVEKRVLIVEGDKSRRVSVVMPSPASTSDTSGTSASSDDADVTHAKTSTPWGGWLLLGVGAAAFGAFGYFGLHGLSQRSDLDRCTPHCDQKDIDATRRSFLFADVSLGIGVVAAVAGTWVLLSSSSAPHTPASPTSTMGFVPLKGGGSVVLTFSYE
jgi:hypothetical protein